MAHREQHGDFGNPAAGQEADDRSRLFQIKVPAKRLSIILRRHGIKKWMADECTAYTGASIDLRFKRENDHHMIDAALNPFDPARSPGPNLRRDVIENAPPGRFCYACKMKV